MAGHCTEYYRDSYGCTASITHCKKLGQFRLRISNPYGHRFILKYYPTYRGAKIAMGRISEGTMQLVQEI